MDRYLSSHRKEWKKEYKNIKSEGKYIRIKSILMKWKNILKYPKSDIEKSLHTVSVVNVERQIANKTTRYQYKCVLTNLIKWLKNKNKLPPNY